MIKINDDDQTIIIKNALSLDTYNLEEHISEALENKEIDLIITVKGIQIRDIKEEKEEDD